MTDFSAITACGECCAGCPKKLDGRCPGCIEADGRVPEWAESGRCRIHACARVHHVQFCGLCAEFPCGKLPALVPWNPGILERMISLRDACMAEMRPRLSILFIGNSHTYCNNMPLMVKRRADEEGFNCRVTMLAHPNWFLSRHAQEPDVRFNILYGKHDYVVLQEHAHPLGPEEEFLDAAAALNRIIREADSTPVIFECWSKKNEPELQDQMNKVHRHVAEEIGALIAPVGENWWGCKRSCPDLEMYDEDGAHASPAGSDFAARYIWETIRDDLRGKVMRS